MNKITIGELVLTDNSQANDSFVIFRNGVTSRVSKQVIEDSIETKIHNNDKHSETYITDSHIINGEHDKIIAGTTTDNTTLSQTGYQTMNGSAKSWRDEAFSLLGRKFTGSRISNDDADATLDFSDTCIIDSDYVYLNIQLNHDRDISADIYPHLHYLQDSSNIPNWLIQYRWQVNGQPIDTTWKNLKLDITEFSYTSGAITQVIMAEPITPPAESNLSDIIQVRLTRDTSNDSGLFAGADPYTGDAQALSFDIHIKTNSLGSFEQYQKEE